MQKYKHHANMHIKYKLAFETDLNIQTPCQHALKILTGNFKGMQTYKHHANRHLKWMQTYKHHANMQLKYKLAFETDLNIQTPCKHTF